MKYFQCLKLHKSPSILIYEINLTEELMDLQLNPNNFMMILEAKDIDEARMKFEHQIYMSVRDTTRKFIKYYPDYFNEARTS